MTSNLDSADSALSVNGVDYAVRTRKILKAVNLQVNFGELVGLVGPNGAGKSTLLSVLSGDIEPASGSVSFEGAPLAEMTKVGLAHGRAVVNQSFVLSFPFTVREVVEMGRHPWSTNRSVDRRIVDDALDECAITHLQDQRVPTLSGGERARVSFARALAQTTKVLLLDEPTAALDISHQEALLASAKSRSSSGAAVVCVLHDLNLAAAYCDRIALMNDGVISLVGTPSEVLTGDVLTAAYNYPIQVLTQDSALAGGSRLVVPQRNLTFN